ncbi:hypothetical protein EVAR_2756_1 [Eumeta japonica]|uniref:Uncharacterized protein n=1 Tax=Eumeta variegata TaxID=151549 RepID=A0A4C1SZK6_EUMVA|nr:hypothetical protein EVAR_2756_1 [Eumeta japonica]
MSTLDSQDDDSKFYNIIEFIENLPRRSRVENEGILMAISAHGLQNNSQSNTDSESNLNSLQVNPSPSTSPLVFEDNAVEDVRAEKNCFWDNLNDASLFPDSIMRNEHEEKNLVSISKMDSGITPDSSPETSKILSNDQQEEDSIDMSKYYKEYGSMSMYSEGVCSDQCDFMDAAVSFAIQNKGLTSYGTDYG